MGDGLGTGLDWTGTGLNWGDARWDAMCCIMNVRLLQASLTLGGRVSGFGWGLPDWEIDGLYPYIQ